jgi:hypothetical protein
MPQGPQLPSVYPDQKPENLGPKPPPPEPPDKPYTAIVLIVLTVLVLAIFVSLAVQSQKPIIYPNTNVDAIEITSHDDVCGTNGLSELGFSTYAPGLVRENFSIRNTDLQGPCTIDTVSALTPGFNVSGANLPLSIPSGSLGYLIFNLTTPSYSFSGNLTINLE